MSLPNNYAMGALIVLEDSLTDPLSDPPNQPIDDPTRSVTVWRPDHTTLAPTPVVTHISTGLYRATFLEDGHPGRWKYKFDGSLGAGSLMAFEVLPNPS